jgi:hypothetical protein
VDIPDAIMLAEQVVEQLKEEAEGAYDLEQCELIGRRVEALQLLIGVAAAQQTEAVCQLGF